MPGDESLRAPDPLRNPDGSFSNLGIRHQKSSQSGINNKSKQANGGKGVDAQLGDHFTGPVLQVYKKILEWVPSLKLSLLQ